MIYSIKIYIGCNLWFRKVTPSVDKMYPQGYIYPRLRTTGLASAEPWLKHPNVSN